MHGDVSQKTLRFAGHYGRMIYINNKNNETNNTMHIFKDNAKWEAGLLHDIDSFKHDDPI